ncbi:MAG: HAMP domain-containing sensor histidine kinase [Rhodospirillaceae bacterium]|nr:HAMP domain-containing sensor histidine kinase [Rhodospirillaceae bacterium]MDD9924278.1 HAMP domain-containing sensor histidine kinase [Rhodospirillaceae bacterium]
MPNDKTDIVADSLVMFELALSVGRTSGESAEARSRQFLRILLARKNLSFGSVWIRSDIVDTDSGDRRHYQLVTALPENRVSQQKVSADHPSVRFIGDREKFTVTPGMKAVRDDDSPLERGANRGQYLSVSLGEIGFLRLHTIKADGFSPREINQLLPVLEIFALSLQNAYAHDQLQESERVAQRARIEAENSKIAAEQAREVAETASRTKSEFIATINHELRTPLTSVQGVLGLLSNGSLCEFDDTVGNLVEIGNRNCQRLGRLIDDILDFEKIESGNMGYTFELTDLVALVHDSLEAASGYAALYDVEFRFDSVPEDLVTVYVDSLRISQVLTNLFSNAAKFCRDGGPVCVDISPNADTVTISVRDNGPGIPLEFRPQLYTPFTQADQSDSRERQGSGLGLSICRAIIRDHNGEIDYETEIDVGTTFTVTLPLSVAKTNVAGKR